MRMELVRSLNINMTDINAIVDTGATRHCSNTTKHMKNIRKTNTSIVVANGATIYATRMGGNASLWDQALMQANGGIKPV